MIGKHFLGYCLVSEFSALMSLLGARPELERLFLFASSHALACASLALFLSAVLPGRYLGSRWVAFCVIFGFCFFIPILGTAGIFISLIYFRFFPGGRARTEFSTVALPPFMVEAGAPGMWMGEGGAWSRIKAGGVSRKARLKALLAVSAGFGGNVSRLLQLATTDNDDEIRLLAFNLFDRREKEISDTITAKLKKLRETDDPAERSGICRILAFSYWEMVYNGLARDELAEFFLQRALLFADKAAEPGHEDPALLILVGRLHLKLKELDRAEEALTKALERGIHREKAIPYLAELAYLRRDFGRLKHLFQKDPLLRHKPGIGPVAQFWMEE